MLAGKYVSDRGYVRQDREYLPKWLNPKDTIADGLKKAKGDGKHD